MNRRAALLVDAGLAPGDVVATNELVTDDYALSFLACCRADVAFLGLGAKLPPAEVAPLVRRAGVKRMLTAGGQPHPAAPDLPAFAIAFPGTPTTAGLDEAMRRSACATAESVVFLQTTSGTTGGTAKIVRIPHRTYTWRADDPLWWEPSDGIFYYPLPNFFGARSFCTFLGVGGTTILSLATDPARIEAEMTAYGADILWTVPATLQMLAESSSLPPPGLHIRIARTSAAPLLPPVVQAFRARYGASVVQEFGTTEGGSMIGTPPGGAPDGSVGKPYRGVIARIVDEDGNDLPDGEAGELILSSPGLTLGYLDSPDATERTYRDGWLRTGDLARRDATGCYFLVGRLALRINVGGFKVAPEEVEAVLEQHPAVREAAVLAMADSARGEVVRAVIVPSDVPPSIGELRRYCRERLASYKVPRQWEFREELPRSSLGKVLRHRL